MESRIVPTAESEKTAIKQTGEKSAVVSQAATLRLFPRLQEINFNRVLEIYGIDEVARIIREDETATAGKTEYPGARILKPLLLKKLNELVSPIMLAVVQGNLRKTEVLIKEHPIVSSVKGEAIDYSRRTIRDATPFQAALCAWDEEMCEMFAKYMDPEEMVRQYNEIFPEGIEAHRASQTPFDFSGMVDVISQSLDVDLRAALNKEQNDTLLCQTLIQFRMDFTNRSSREKIFNPQHLLQAFQLYEANYGRWNWDQRDLFWRQVVGFVQRFLPANIAQDVAQDIYSRIDGVDDYEKARRRFKFRQDDGSIFPLDFDSHSGLGFDYAVSLRPRQVSRELVGADWKSPRMCYKHYFKQKQRACQITQLISKCNEARSCSIL